MGKISQIGVAGPQQNAVDVLTEVLRAGSHKLLAAALDVEIEEFLAKFADEKDQRGRQRIVRNGFHQPREIQTGIGSIQVKAPRARDQEPAQGPSSSHRRSCRRTCGAARASKSCCPGCT